MKENTAGMNSACHPRDIAIEKIIVHDTARWSYFQWFLLGLYELVAKEGFAVNFQGPLWKKIFLWSTSDFLARMGSVYFIIV